MHSVVETADFIADADDAGMSEEERRRVVDLVARRPTAGDLITGSGGARKIRVAGRGKGKSGGYRVISYYAGDDVPVFLLTVYSKGERVDLTAAQRNTLRADLAGLAAAWRKGRRK